jgi:hypothetical protein
MRVIDKRKDYYDTCQGFGVDPKLIYVREEREIEIPTGWRSTRKEDAFLDMVRPLLSKLFPAGDHLERGLVAFCGVAYPFYELGDKIIYTREKLIKAARSYRDPVAGPWRKENLLIELGLKEQGRPRHRNKPPWRSYAHPRLTKKQWARFETEFDPHIPDKIFLHFGAPILLIKPEFAGKKTLVINPLLRPWNFASVIDPYSAYQELAMYVGNNMVCQKDPNPPIPDKIKVESKGFDNWSFRTHKDDSKKPRKKKKG